MNFKKYYLEQPTSELQKLLNKYNTSDHKIDVWNAFVDSNLDGINDDDFSIFPRLIPESYFPSIYHTCKNITEFLLKLLSLPEKEMRAIIPEGPIRNHLFDELKVAKYKTNRLIGSFRFDMAIVGPPNKHNPPKLLEVNEIGFDGLARSTFFQNTLLSLIPELRERVIALDTAKAEAKNMLRLGRNIVRLQYDSYNWDEEYLKMTSEKMGLHLHLISPSQYGCKFSEKDYPLMKKLPFTFPNGVAKVGSQLKPDAFNMSFAFTYEDLKKEKNLYANMVKSKTPQYGPVLTGLVATKTILILLSDPSLRKKFLGSKNILQNAILPAFSLKNNLELVIKDYQELVIKHTDGCGGEQVFMGKELLKTLKKIKPQNEHEWVLQHKTLLNLIHVNGILSRPKKVISDLGVFIQYDWSNNKFNHFEVGGLMCRGTNKGLKVNVSSGGLQVAVMLEKGV